MFDIVSLVKTAGYVGIFGMVFAESGLFFGFFFPGESLLFTADLWPRAGFSIFTSSRRLCLQVGCLVIPSGMHLDASRPRDIYKRKLSVFQQKTHRTRVFLRKIRPEDDHSRPFRSYRALLHRYLPASVICGIKHSLSTTSLAAHYGGWRYRYRILSWQYHPKSRTLSRTDRFTHHICFLIPLAMEYIAHKRKNKPARGQRHSGLICDTPEASRQLRPHDFVALLGVKYRRQPRST